MPFIRCLLVFFLIVSFSSGAEIQTLSGKVLQGKIQSISEQEIVLVADGKEEKTPLSQILEVNFRKIDPSLQPEKYQLLRLLDDSDLKCSKIAFQGDILEATLISGQVAKLPLNSVIAWLRDAAQEETRKQWKELLSKNTKTDRLLVNRSGSLIELEGTITEVSKDGDKIQFRRAPNVVLPILVSKLSGMIFLRTGVQTKYAPVCLVTDVSGNTLAASKITVKGDTYSVVMATGAKVNIAESALANLNYNQGKLTYLSSITPTKAKTETGVGFHFPYRKDSNLDGQAPIYLGPESKSFSKGLSMHSYTELEYELNAKFKTFKATLGVDPRIGTESEAIVTVRCDGLQVFKQKVDPKKLIPISLNVRNVNKLKIIVSSDPNNILDLHDHATLADARVSQ